MTLAILEATPRTRASASGRSRSDPTALGDALGELIGINTAVYAQPISTGAGRVPQTPEGIGFAIPVRTAKAVLGSSGAY